MRIYLRDHKFSNGTSDWSNVLQKCFAICQGSYDSNDSWNEGVLCQENDESEKFKLPDSLLFVHADSDDDRGKWSAATSWLQGHVVFITTPGGFSANTVEAAIKKSDQSSKVVRERLHACRWALSQFEADKPFVQAILNDDPKWWRLLQPAPTEHLHAMLLLCEAWILSDGKAECEYSGIKIKAPITPDDWFRPFKKEVGVTAAKEIAAEMLPLEIRVKVESSLTQIAKTTKVLIDDVKELKEVLEAARKTL